VAAEMLGHDDGGGKVARQAPEDVTERFDPAGGRDDADDVNRVISHGAPSNNALVGIL
jgi:hypothetical protein